MFALVKPRGGLTAKGETAKNEVLRERRVKCEVRTFSIDKTKQSLGSLSNITTSLGRSYFFTSRFLFVQKAWLSPLITETAYNCETTNKQMNLILHHIVLSIYNFSE